VDRYFANNRNAMSGEVKNGTFSSRFEHVETSLFSEPMQSGRYGTHRQVYEKRSSKGDAEGRYSTALLERDCRNDGSRSAPHYEGSRE
jgi:hypothetical protein